MSRRTDTSWSVGLRDAPDDGRPGGRRWRVGAVVALVVGAVAAVALLVPGPADDPTGEADDVVTRESPAQGDGTPATADGAIAGPTVTGGADGGPVTATDVERLTGDVVGDDAGAHAPSAQEVEELPVTTGDEPAVREGDDVADTAPDPAELDALVDEAAELEAQLEADVAELQALLDAAP